MGAGFQKVMRTLLHIKAENVDNSGWPPKIYCDTFKQARKDCVSKLNQAHTDCDRKGCRKYPSQQSFEPEF